MDKNSLKRLVEHGARMEPLAPLEKALWTSTLDSLLDGVLTTPRREPLYEDFLRQHRGLRTAGSARRVVRVVKRLIATLLDPGS